MRQKINSIAQHFRLPVVCVLCHHYHQGFHAVCDPCKNQFTAIKHPCEICSLPLTDASFAICGHCIKQRPVFDKVLTAYSFEDPLRTLLHEFKYQKGLYLRSFLIKLILDAQNKQTPVPDCLIPVPLHPQRLRQRGFNQAAELAKGLAKQSGIPCDLAICTKIINTQPQVGLNREERRKNLRLSFAVKPCSYRHIVLIDDLLTTGSTADELANLFKKQGVERVDVWCCARTSGE